jgi:hypothetical protein
LVKKTKAMKETNEQINELCVWDMPNTVTLRDGWDNQEVPEASPRNMLVMMNKINELVQRVNELTQEIK